MGMCEPGTPAESAEGATEQHTLPIFIHLFSRTQEANIKWAVVFRPAVRMVFRGGADKYVRPRIKYLDLLKKMPR